MKIPTQKGEHSCKYTELPLKQKEGIDTGGQLKCGEFFKAPDTSATPAQYSNESAYINIYTKVYRDSKNILMVF